jgi:formyl-CoA transferase
LSKPLQGVRVLDLSAVISGPLCSYQLAMLGAEIIKIEPPETGDLSRRLGGDPDLNAQLMGVSFLSNNAGKKSVTVNLKSSEGLEILKDLTADCDVLLENFRPGTMARLNFDYEAARQIKPDLIWCSISGFGQNGPLAQRGAYDQTIQGYCGVMALTGNAETAPQRVGYQICDTMAAVTAAFAISAALYRRTVSGEGEYIDVSMLDASLASFPSWPMSNLLNAGKAPKPMGNDNGASSPSGVFRTADSPINIVANDQGQYETLCRTIGAPELIEDDRFLTRPLSVDNREALRELLEEKLANKGAAAWVELLSASGVPVGPILSLKEAIENPQVAARDLIKTFDASVIGREFSVHRLGFNLASALPDVDLPPPQLGEHTDEILSRLGYSEHEIPVLREKGVI